LCCGEKDFRDGLIVVVLDFQEQPSRPFFIINLLPRHLYTRKKKKDSSKLRSRVTQICLTRSRRQYLPRAPFFFSLFFFPFLLRLFFSLNGDGEAKAEKKKKRRMGVKKRQRKRN
jgi:hypothetical protein